jgi:O-antigen ligase
MDKIKQLRNHILFLYSESVIFFLVFYSMMMPQRFKQIEGIVIDGINRSHELYLYAVLIIVKVIIDIFYKRIRIDKVLWILIGLSLTYMIFSTIFTGINPQSLYALFTMIIPTSMLLFLEFKNHQTKQLFFYFIGFMTIFYSIFVLLFLTNYEIFESLISYSRRPHLMIGSSVAVSYVLVIFLPVNIYKLYASNKVISKAYFFFASVISIGAVAMLLSRGAFITLVIVLVLAFILYKGNLKTNLFICLFIVLGLLSLYYLHITYDLTRVFNDIDLDGSDRSRRDAFLLGYEIFKDHLIFGTGMGQYFIRVWESSTLIYNKMSGLVDPHNVYIMMLSELGIVGSLLYASIHGYILLKALKFKVYNKKIRILLVYVALGIMHLGGSHLMNELSVAVVMISVILLVKDEEVQDATTS